MKWLACKTVVIDGRKWSVQKQYDKMGRWTHKVRLWDAIRKVYISIV